MANIYILLTLDYEIFGNGTGDVQSHLIKPTEEILRIAKKHNIPITLMVDICEYWAFKNEETSGNLPTGFLPARWIEEQLINCIQNNHDIQLHCHPQWLNYSYNPTKNEWILNFDHWRTSSLSYEQAYKMFSEGKTTLENLLKPYKSNYECLAFRAGALSIQPEKHILEALRDANFKIDTTSAPECRFENNHTYYDFRSSPKKPYWKVFDNITKESSTGLWEFPIYVQKSSSWGILRHKLKRLFQILFLRNSAASKNGSARPFSFSNVPLLTRNLLFDFCELDPGLLTNFIDKAKQEFIEENIVPLIAIGHSKTFKNPEHFDRFIQMALKRKCIFTSFPNILKVLGEESSEKHIPR